MTFRTAYFFAALLLAASPVFAQSYSDLTHKADSLYQAKNYKLSAKTFAAAFKTGKPTYSEYYNAACSAALAGDKKQAFQFLELAIANGWTDVKHLKSDSDLNMLHNEKRWKKTVAELEEKVARIEANYDKPLQAELLKIYDLDQTIRHEYIKVAGELGFKHPKVDSLAKIMIYQDSLNQEKITAMLDKKGWIGPDRVGPLASQTVFLVIQHADLPTQIKYLPMAREAARTGKLNPSNLALLEDRVLIRQGKKQLYGSQVGRNEQTGIHYVLPLENPLEVDKRRAEMGLPPLAEYVKYWKMSWNAEEFHKAQEQQNVEDKN